MSSFLIFFFFFLFSAQNTAHRGSSSPAQQQAVFLKAVNDWVNVPDSLCRSLVSDHTSELVHESDDGVRLCEGVRVHGRRRFLGDAPPLVFFNVRTFFENGSIESLEGIPCSITLVDIQYHLVAATFFFGAHYTASVFVHGIGWFVYDGLDDEQDMLDFVGDIKNVRVPGLNHVLFAKETLL